MGAGGLGVLAGWWALEQGGRALPVDCQWEVLLSVEAQTLQKTAVRLWKMMLQLLIGLMWVSYWVPGLALAALVATEARPKFPAANTNRS